MIDIQKMIEDRDIAENERVTVNLGDWGTVVLRKRIPDAYKDVMAETVAGAVLMDDYHPAKKEYAMAITLFQMYIADEHDLAAFGLTDNDTGTEAIGNVFAERVARKIYDACPEIERYMVDVSSAADQKIEYILAKRNAELSGGTATAAAQALEDLDVCLKKAGDFFTNFQKQLNANAVRLRKSITPEDVKGYIDDITRTLDESIRTHSALKTAQ